LLARLDRRLVTPVGLFLGRGQEREVLGALCDEVCNLGTGPLVPLSKEGYGRFYVPNLLKKAGIFLRAVFAAAAAIRRLKLDVLHVQFYPLHLIAGLACRMANVPCIWHWHGTYHRQGLANRIITAAFRYLADEIVCISRCVASTLPPAGQAKATVVYDGVDTGRIRTHQRKGELRRMLGLDDSHLLAGMFGSITLYKGHECFIRAAARVSQEFPEARFVIVGHENKVVQQRHGLTKKFKNLAEEMKVAGRILWPGYLEDAPLYMSDCDLVCVLTYPFGTCLGEGFGLVIAEAMAAGAAVISTRCGAPPEIIEDKVSGLLIPPQDSQALAEAMTTLLGDPARRQAMILAGRQRVAEHFDISRTARGMEEVYLRHHQRPGRR
jgi:glycosyltransferase involved in cell wall biosynthesis